MKPGRGLVEQALKVDVHAIVRAVRQSGLPACALTWVIGGRQVSGAAAMTQDRLLVLVANQVFRAELVWQRPHFGGIAASLACPSCARAVRTLFVGGERMECRRCSGLTYQCQLEQGPDRARRRALKAMCRIDPSHASLTSMPARRAGMHHRTYMRSLATVANLLQVSDAALQDEFLKLKEARSRLPDRGGE